MLNQGRSERIGFFSPNSCLFVLFLLVSFSTAPLLTAQEQNPDMPSTAVFWRYGTDRYNRPALVESLEVPSGEDPYAYLAQHQNMASWSVSKNGDIGVLSENPSTGQVPIIGLHKISREDQFALTPDRFRDLLKFLRDDGWYLVSDVQYLQGDFSQVPSGMKLAVMGSDDASHGVFVYETHGDRMLGEVRRRFGNPVVDPDCMVAILEHYLPEENGRRNFTFYVSFDALPFRQLDGVKNPGFPYAGIPVVEEKLQYIDENFRLGLHTLSHRYAMSMSTQEFVEDVLAGWTALDDYLDGKAETVATLAYPFGLGEDAPELRHALNGLRNGDRALLGAFNFNNTLSPAPGVLQETLDVPRINVDNRTFGDSMERLAALEPSMTHRIFVWESDRKRLPRSRFSVGAGAEEEVWILVKSPE